MRCEAEVVVRAERKGAWRLRAYPKAVRLAKVFQRRYEVGEWPRHLFHVKLFCFCFDRSFGVHVQSVIDAHQHAAEHVTGSALEAGSAAALLFEVVCESNRREEDGVGWNGATLRHESTDALVDQPSEVLELALVCAADDLVGLTCDAQLDRSTFHEHRTYTQRSAL